jgi:hypothetical protein
MTYGADVRKATATIRVTAEFEIHDTNTDFLLLKSAVDYAMKQVPPNMAARHCDLRFVSLAKLDKPKK